MPIGYFLDKILFDIQRTFYIVTFTHKCCPKNNWSEIFALTVWPRNKKYQFSTLCSLLSASVPAAVAIRITTIMA